MTTATIPCPPSATPNPSCPLTSNPLTGRDIYLASRTTRQRWSYKRLIQRDMDVRGLTLLQLWEDVKRRPAKPFRHYVTQLRWMVWAELGYPRPEGV